jgi:hypothetical protein
MTSRTILRTAIPLALLLATAAEGAAQYVTFIATLSKEGTELSTAVLGSTAVRDGFSPLSRNSHHTQCDTETRTVCLPAGCIIDYGRTYSTNDPAYAGRGFGRGGPGYGVVMNRVISVGGSASYHLDPATRCLTSTVTVCSKLFVSGASYEGYQEIYGKCPTSQPWKKTTTVAYVLNYTPAPGKYTHFIDWDPPAGSPNGIPGTATTLKWGYTIDSLTASPSMPNPPLQAGMFKADPNVPQNGANGPQFWAKYSLDNDLSVGAMEVTQGIQNESNQMPLVAGRRTMVRVYLNSRFNVGGVEAQLRGSRNGVSLGPPLAAETEIQGQTTGGDRINLNDSFLFELPAAWTLEGALTLAVDIDPNNRIQETNEQNNTYETLVLFNPQTAIKVTSVPLHLHPNGDSSLPPLIYTDNQPSFWPILGDLLRFHPVSSLLYWDCDVDVQQPVGHDLFGREWDLRSGFDQALLLTRVSLVRALSSCGDSDMHWVGLVDPGISTDTGSGSTLGIAVPFGRASWVKMQDDVGPVWSVDGGATLAHELGHNLGLFHVDCAGTEGFPLTTSYPHPYPNCRLAVGADGYFGLDVYHDLWGLPDPAVISNDPAAPYGNQAFPLMGYRDPQWIDPFDYCHLLLSNGIFCNPQLMAKAFPDSLKAGVFASLSDFGAAVPPPPVVPRRQSPPVSPKVLPLYLMVSGAFEASTGTVAELGVQRLVAPPANALAARVDAPQPTDGPTSPDGSLDLVQLRDGNVVAVNTFPLDGLDGLNGFYSFLEVVPMSPVVNGVQIRRNGQVLAQKLASANPPSVHILSPNGGGQLLPGTQVSWQAVDPDGDPLTYDVFYSADGGRTWRLLAMGLTAASYQLPARLPGSSRALLRVTAHDGFWSASDDTDSTFTVAGSPPRAIILRANGSVVRLGSTVHLTGIATDLEQGPITDPQRFTWSSDRDGALGNGLEIATRTLSKGVHQITLKVVDDDGNVGSATIVLYVGVNPPRS